jgi:hypothetical protein
LQAWLSVWISVSELAGLGGWASAAKAASQIIEQHEVTPFAKTQANAYRHPAAINTQHPVATERSATHSNQQYE